MKIKLNNKIKNIFLVVNFLILFIAVGISSLKEESYKKSESFYLKLMPYDPRSLIQGDYMKLNYEITDKAYSSNFFKEKNKKELFFEGYIIVVLDKNRVGQFYDVSQKKYEDENKIFIKFKAKNPTIDINAGSFMFQEGDAHLYEKAVYSEVVSADDGLRILNLADENFKIIK